MFSIYIVKSLVKDWYYVGHASDIDSRIRSHNEGRVRSTRPYKPFVLVHHEEFNTKGEAFKREQQIKRYKHGQAFKKLIGI